MNKNYVVIAESFKEAKFHMMASSLLKELKPTKNRGHLRIEGNNWKMFYIRDVNQLRGLCNVELIRVGRYWLRKDLPAIEMEVRACNV